MSQPQMHGSLGSKNGISIGSAVVAAKTPNAFQWGQTTPKIAPFPCGVWIPIWCMVPWAHPTNPVNDRFGRFFCWDRPCNQHRNTQTERPRHVWFVAIGHIIHKRTFETGSALLGRLYRRVDLKIISIPALLETLRAVWQTEFLPLTFELLSAFSSPTGDVRS